MAGAERGLSRLLERHEAARRRGVPTLTVIEQDALPVAERIWGARPVIAVKDGDDVVAWFSTAVDLGRLAARVIATVLERPEEEVGHALEMSGEPELGALMSSYSVLERRRDVAPVIESIVGAKELGVDALGPLARVVDGAPTFVIDDLEQGCELVLTAPELSVVVVTSAEAIAEFLADRDDRAAALVREGRIEMPRAPEVTPVIDEVAAVHQAALASYRELVAGQIDPDGARSAAEALLYARLEVGPPTAGVFRLNEHMEFAFGPRPAEIDLYSGRHALAVEVDGYYHFTDSAAYRRDRRKDALLQRYEIFVLRFLADDVLERLEEVVAAIIDVVRWRDQQGGRSGGD
jgi:hypothetical protein